MGVQLMGGLRPSIGMAREEVEAMLIGKVIRDPEAEAEILAALLRAREEWARHYEAPHLQRGRIE